MKYVLIIEEIGAGVGLSSGAQDTFNLRYLLEMYGFSVDVLRFRRIRHLLFSRDGLCLESFSEKGSRIGASSDLASLKGRYDLILLNGPIVSLLFLAVFKPYFQRAKFWYHTVDLHYLRLARQSSVERRVLLRMAAIVLGWAENWSAQHADVATVMSLEEKALLLASAPKARVFEFPFFRRSSGIGSSFCDREGVVFVGDGSHGPNVDAVVFFVTHVMPILRAKLKETNFYVVGANYPHCVSQLASSSIHFMGYVEDLSGFLDLRRVAVAPLRYGAGIKGKVATYMGSGIPCVLTEIAAEGMAIKDYWNALIADDPISFARSIQRLHEDYALWGSISSVALQHAEALWGQGKAAAKLSNVLRALGYQDGSI